MVFDRWSTIASIKSHLVQGLLLQIAHDKYSELTEGVRKFPNPSPICNIRNETTSRCAFSHF